MDHGIVVLGEYEIGKRNPYKRLRILAHPLFDAKIVGGTMTVRKNRVVMTSLLGRKLLLEEHVHHKNEDRSDDSPRNLELISAADHNAHHKLGAVHTEEAKQKISAGLSEAYRCGRKKLSAPDWTGKKHSEITKQKISDSKKDAIANGLIEKPKPPIHIGAENNKAVLTDELVIEIRRRAAKGESKKTLANEYRVAIQTIYNVVNRSNWKHI